MVVLNGVLWTHIKEMVLLVIIEEMLIVMMVNVTVTTLSVTLCGE